MIAEFFITWFVVFVIMTVICNRFGYDVDDLMQPKDGSDNN